jgi:hypothetical protein
MFVLFGFVALAVDVGVLYSARTAAQRAADAAALAGALVFAVDTTPQVADIQAKAVATAAENNILGTPVTITAGDVNVDMANRRVTVDVERSQARGNPVETYFARMFVNSADIQVEAIAEASPVATTSDCPKPWMLPSTIFHPPHISPCQACEPDAEKYDVGPGTWPWPGFDVGLGPPPPGPRALVDQAGNVTAYARWLTQTGSYTPPTVPANQFIIKPQSPADALVPSNFYPIQTSGVGAALYRADIASCGNDVKCGDQYTVETGNMLGPTGQGVRDLVSIEQRTYRLGAGEHRYEDPGGYHRAPNPQLCVVPIWNACNDPFFVYDPGAGQCPIEVVGSGTGTWYTVSAFGQIFVERIVGQGAQVRMIDIANCSGFAGPINLDEVGPLAIPVRLVRVPEEDNG